ncbi:MAG: PHP domain-containing protein [Candidatus Altiarchaeota archaeon]|nr:PHP domain-containing protein [Candidatus Altiarchaeota archaeon]
MRVDLHVHTNFSDGKNSPVEMIAGAKRAGLGAIAITDHNTVEGWKNLNLRPNGFIVLPGTELSTDKGHVILVGIKDMPPTKILEELLDWVKDNNVFAAAAHVYDLPFRNPMGDYAFEVFKVIEAMNGQTPRHMCKRAISAAVKNNIKYLCNSDAHKVQHLGTYYNNVPGETAEELMDNLLKGNFEPLLKLPHSFDFVSKRIF